MKRCQMCGVAFSGRATKEHVIPTWLVSGFLSKDLTVTGTFFEPAGSVKEERSHRLKDFVLGGVCSSCNDGWMSKLEERCRQVLVPLVQGRVPATSLGSSDLFSIARWACKTAFVLNRATGFYALAPNEVRFQFARDHLSIPDGLSVYLSEAKPDRPLGWGQTSGTSIYSDTAARENEQLYSHGARVAIQIGWIVFVVAFWPHKHFVLAPWAGVHNQIWPAESTDYWIDHRYLDEADPLSVNSALATYRILDNLGAVRLGTQRLRLAVPKNRDVFVSGLEPAGKTRPPLRIPTILTPEQNRAVQAWLDDGRLNDRSLTS